MGLHCKTSEVNPGNIYLGGWQSRPYNSNMKQIVSLKRSLAFFSRTLCAVFPGSATIQLMRLLNGIHLNSVELEPVIKSIKRRTPCNLLVFGLGNDSQFWASLNRRGRTIFLEDNEYWYKVILQRDPFIRAYLVNYQTRRSQWQELLDTPDLLIMSLPEEIQMTSWDIILVDGPNGFNDDNPGRMKSIYLASKLASKTGGKYSCTIVIVRLNRLTVTNISSPRISFLKLES